MRKDFPGYFKLSDAEIKGLWDSSIITLDANILLNLYRYSDETKENFFKVFEKLKDRIWIPHQAAKEFFDRRLTVIGQQEKSYEDAISSLKAVEEEFKNSRQHPFITQKSLKKFSQLTKDITDELNSSKDFHTNRLLNDDVLDRIEVLFDGKVGKECNADRLKELYSEGEERFKNKVPPGYKDATKKDLTDKDIRKYGDFIIWKQTLDKGTDDKSGIILVTDDRKEDWWVRFKGKTLGPRPELIKEFSDETNQLFHMYQPDRFLEYARDYFNEDIKQNSIDEIRDLRKLDEKKLLRIQRNRLAYKSFRERKKELEREKIELTEHLDEVTAVKSDLNDQLDKQQKSFTNSSQTPSDYDMLVRLQKQLGFYQFKSETLARKLIKVDSELDEIKKKTISI